MKGEMTVEWPVPPNLVLYTKLVGHPPPKGVPQWSIEVDNLMVEIKPKVPQILTRELQDKLLDDLDKLLVGYMESLGVEVER